MKLSRVSPLTGKTNTMDLPTLTQERLDGWLRSRALVQNAFPELSADAREFILTGYTQDDWDSMFGVEEDEE